MKIIMVMFDSLNRRMLPPYGCDWTHAPNFARLARRAATFDNSYVCSMPCMPARRDLHTGRPNFLHRSWGPIEPFDFSAPEALSKAGVYTHLVSDHYHYWEDPAGTYHGRYNSWEFFRGQEGDPFVGQVKDPVIPPNLNGKGRRQDWVNRPHLTRDEDMPQTKTFRAGVDFIDRNAKEDRWFLQIECFDPHEPFWSHRQYKDLYPHEYHGPVFDWPAYGPVKETMEEVRHVRFEYAALLSKCDASLGDVLDAMDRHDLLKDTMLVVWTDHGYMLGEHGCWAKNWQPLYSEIAHTPFFVWDPRSPESAGSRRGALVQPSIDLAPTMLDFFGLPIPDSVLGKNLRDAVVSDRAVREAAIFGYFGNRVNVTDGRHVYLREPVHADGGPLYQYTLCAPSPRGGLDQLAAMESAPPLSFSRGARVMKIPVRPSGPRALKASCDHLLFDLQSDPSQEKPLKDERLEREMMAAMSKLMRECDAPPEQFERMGLPSPDAAA